jgi:hypothetical protein
MTVGCACRLACSHFLSTLVLATFCVSAWEWVVWHPVDRQCIVRGDSVSRTNWNMPVCCSVTCFRLCGVGMPLANNLFRYVFCVLKMFICHWVGWYWLILCLLCWVHKIKSITGSQSTPKCECYTNAHGIGCTNQKFSKEKCWRTVSQAVIQGVSRL